MNNNGNKDGSYLFELFDQDKHFKSNSDHRFFQLNETK